MHFNPIRLTSLWCVIFFSVIGSKHAQSDVPRGRFTNVINLGPDVNTSSADTLQMLSADGLTLYFSSSRGGGMDLYQATRSTVNDAFGDVVNLGAEVNSPDRENWPSISVDGLTLYFQSTRSGGEGDFDLWQATRDTINDEFGDVMNLGPQVNTNYRERSPHITPDGLTLYFTSTRPGGEDESGDIYKATRESTSDSFANVTRLGTGVNGPTHEFGPSLSSDGLVMFFSDRFDAPFRPGGQGGPDLWVAVRESIDAPFGDVVNLDDFSNGSDINSEFFENAPSISRDWPAAGSQLHYSARPADGFGSFDILQATWVPETRGDFNGDGELTHADVDILTTEISVGTSNLAIDLSGDGTVDDADLTEWLSTAASHNGFGEAYLLGDSNLDGGVDAIDLNNLALSWQQDTAKWSGGNFTADGVVDSADLNALALNWRQSIPMASAVSAPVPEPSAILLTFLGFASVWMRARRR